MLATLLVALFLSNARVRADHDANADRFYWMTWYNDYWYNWDFESQSAGRTNVDWPVNVIFTNNAWISKVKNAYLNLRDAQGRQKWFQNKSTGGTCGGTMWMYLNDASPATGAHWDRDDGIKGGYLNPGGYKCVPGGGEWSIHFRLYADNPDQGGNDMMGYNTQWGYWVLASSHFDYDECNYPWDPICNPRHGWTETAEGWIGNDAINIWGSGAVTWNAWGFLNDQGWPTGYYAGNHYVNNNGWATQVRVP